MESFDWKTESDTPAPTQVSVVTDAVTADEALRRVRKGEFLRYEGDFHNARQLLSAMARRLPAPRPGSTPLETFRAERRARSLEHETLGRVVVELDERFECRLKRAPAGIAEACTQAWGAPTATRTLVPLKTLVGVMSAAQWRLKGLSVPGLSRPLVTHYGVFVPTRTEYVEVLRRLDGVEGARCVDVGTGTGVLALTLLARGATTVVGTDLEPRAVANARENAERFGVSERFRVEQRELFPDERADLIVFNPPWVPEAPKNRVDRAVFDEGGQTLERFLAGLAQHLSPGGRGALILSNLAELLGLRAPGALRDAFTRHGLTCVHTLEQKAKHGKAKDRGDALHAVRSREVTSLYVLQPAAR